LPLAFFLFLENEVPIGLSGLRDKTFFSFVALYTQPQMSLAVHLIYEREGFDISYLVWFYYALYLLDGDPSVSHVECQRSLFDVATGLPYFYIVSCVATHCEVDLKHVSKARGG
jgi:hypothetical protein